MERLMNFNQFLSVGHRDPMSLISNYLSEEDLFNLSYVDKHTNEIIKRGIIWNRHFKIIRTNVCTLNFFELYNNNLARFCKHYCSEVNNYLKPHDETCQLNYKDTACRKDSPFRRILDPKTYKFILEFFGPCETKKTPIRIFEKKIQLDKLLMRKLNQSQLNSQLTRAFAENDLKSMQVWIEAGAKRIDVSVIPKIYDEVFFKKVDCLMRAGLMNDLLMTKVDQSHLNSQLTRAFAENDLKSMQVLIEAGAKRIDVSAIPKIYDEVFFKKVDCLMRAGLIKKERDSFLGSIISQGASPEIIKELLARGLRADCVSSKDLENSRCRVQILSLLLEAGLCARSYGMHGIHAISTDSENWNVQINESFKLLLLAGSKVDQKLLDICLSYNYPVEAMELFSMLLDIDDNSNKLKSILFFSGITEEFKKIILSVTKVIREGIVLAFVMNTSRLYLASMVYAWKLTQIKRDILVSGNYQQEVNETIKEFKEIHQYLKLQLTEEKKRFIVQVILSALSK